MTLAIAPTTAMNLLRAGAIERDEAAVALSVGRSTPIDRRTLPAIDGAGLTEAEFFRLNGFGNRARCAYAASMPDADAVELARVERQARMDGLRAVLRDRPAAPPLNSPACCSPSEAAPCSACVGETVAIEIVATDGDDEADPSFRVTDDLGDVYFEKAPGLTLERVIDFVIARLTDNPKAFEAERVIWDDRGSVLAVIARREDGRPQAIRLDAPPEYLTVTIHDEPVVAGADPSMTPDEIEDLAGLNASNPAGAFEADLSRFPAFDRWPASTEDYFWGVWGDPNEPATEPASLSLVELIDCQAERLRRMQTEAGELMARCLAELAKSARLIGARTPGDLADGDFPPRRAGVARGPQPRTLALGGSGLSDRDVERMTGAVG